jgi:hypothetical protein
VLRHPTEVPQLDDLSLPLIHSHQLVQCLVQEQHFTVNRQGGANPIVERDAQPGAWSLGRLALARMIDQDAPHHVRGDAEEVGAVLPGNPVLTCEAHIGLVDERRRLQRVIKSLPTKIRRGLSSELAIDERDQIVTGSQVASTPCS